MAEILSAKGLSKRFGPIVALNDVSLSLGAGEVRALCGENGAGKSTLVKLLMGVYRPDAGVIEVDGQPRDIRHPQQAQEAGLALVAQELSLAPQLSVLDNIWLGSTGVPFLHRRPELRTKAERALAMIGADYIELDTPVAALAIGQRQMVEIARMLAREARILILDEPTATLSDVEIERIFVALRALKAENRSVLYITHRLGEVFEICDSVTVLRNGEHVGTQALGALDRDRLIELMLGRSFAEMYPDTAHVEVEDPVLTVDNLAVPGAVENFSMVAPRGEIVCVAGQLGSGASSIVRALAGLEPDATGQVVVNGTPLALGSVPNALAAGIQFVTEDRANEGLFLRMKVMENLVATQLDRFRRFGFLSWPGIASAAAQLADRVRVDRRRLSSHANELSGGNQQKLLFGRALDSGAAGVLLMNEPTRGVDVGARAEIYRIMREICGQGFALVMTSSDLEEVAGMADIVITMYRGRQVAIYRRGEIAIHRILADITHPASAVEARA